MPFVIQGFNKYLGLWEERSQVQMARRALMIYVKLHLAELGEESERDARYVNRPFYFFCTGIYGF